MSTDLETLVRSTLAGRAQTITSGPEWAGPTALMNLPGPNRNRRWLAVVAAAAVVFAVGAGAVALRESRDRSTPPATNVPTPPPTHAPTIIASPSPKESSPTPPPTANVTELPSCATTLPAAWTQALQHSVVDLGGRTVSPLTVAPDRSLVALRDDGVTPGSAREVVYAPPGGPASVVYTIKDPDSTSVQLGEVSGPWLVLGLWNNPRSPKNTVPGNSSIGLRGIVVVNLENLTSEVIAGTDTSVPGRSASNQVIQSFAVNDGVVYWDARAHPTDSAAKLNAYTLGSGKTATVYTGSIGYVRANAAGVGWPDANGSFFFAVHNQLPSAVQKAMTPFAEPRLRTDGTSYAWIDSPQDVYWWKPGIAKPVHLRLPAGVGLNTQDFGGYVSVVGHMLISDSATPMVIDMTRGAVAPFPATGLFGAQRGELIDHTGSVFYGLAFTGTAGHFENGYWADTAVSALRVDISGLPDLTC